MAMRRTMATALRMEKMTARVFCPLTGNANGGNPVTIFRLVDALSPSQCAQLARTCPWESVFVWKNDAKMAFYAPSGENMRFCAHAAMGGAYAAGLSEFTVMNDDCNDAKYQTSFQNDTQIMSLTMNDVPWSQEPVEHPMALHRILRDYHQVQPSVDCTLPVLPVVMETPPEDTTDHNEEDGPILQKTQHRVVPLPTFVQATLQQRRKTLVYINSYAALQERVVPPPPSAAAVHYPRALSDQLQDSTGLYLYTSKQQRQPVQAPEIAAPEDAWECRQFPRASGYAEDPATGVAAALLAVGLHLCEQSLWSGGTAMEEEMEEETTSSATRYTFHQGTAMGRPSVLYVQDIQLQLEPPEEEEEEIVESPPEDEVMTTTTLEDGDMTTTDAEAIMEAEIVSSSSTEEVSLPTAESKEKKPKPRTKFRGRVSFTLSGRIEVDAKEEVDF